MDKKPVINTAVFACIASAAITLAAIGITIHAFTLPRGVLEELCFIFYCVLFLLPTVILNIAFAIKMKKVNLAKAILISILSVFSLLISMGVANWI